MSDSTELDHIQSLSTVEVALVNETRINLQNFLNTDPFDSTELSRHRMLVDESFEKLKQKFYRVSKVAEQYYNPKQRYSAAGPFSNFEGLGRSLFDSFSYYLRFSNSTTMEEYVENCKMILTYLRAASYFDR